MIGVPEGGFRCVLLLPCPKSDVGNVIRPEVAVALRVYGENAQELCGAAEGVLKVWCTPTVPTVRYLDHLSLGGVRHGRAGVRVADGGVLTPSREHRVHRLSVGHVREALHDEVHRGRAVRARHGRSRFSAIDRYRCPVDDLHLQAVDGVGRGRHAGPLDQAALVERLSPRDQDRTVGVQGLPRQVQPRYRYPVPFEIGQEVRGAPPRCRVDDAGVAGAETDDGAAPTAIAPFSQWLVWPLPSATPSGVDMYCHPARRPKNCDPPGGGQ